MIDRGVVRDLEDPRRELELGIVRADGIQDLDERLLRQVLGEGAVAHHAIQQRENGPLVAAHQLAERGFVALLGPRHDLRIAGAGQVARPIFRAYDAPPSSASCVRGCRALGWRSEAVVRTQHVRRDRAALRSAEPSLEPQCGPLLAPRRGATARVGAATRRHLSRSLRRHARSRGDARPRARIPRDRARRGLRASHAGAGEGKAPRTRPVGADALALPFVDARFDGAMVAFGVRNLADLDAGLRETHRVLRPGARFVVLEFTTPRFAPLRALYLFYFRRVLPAIGRAVSKHRDAYTYLPESVLDFPDPDAFARRLEAAGFSKVGYEILTGGICALHHGTR